MEDDDDEEAVIPDSPEGISTRGGEDVGRAWSAEVKPFQHFLSPTRL